MVRPFSAATPTALAGALALAITPAFSHDAVAQGVNKTAGDLLIRGRLIVVSPDAEADITAIGGTADIETSYVPEFDFTYFFTDHIAAELIAAVTPHDVTATGTALDDVDLGDVWLLPPTLLAQYHFLPKGAVSPYIGLGINYTVFFNDDLPSTGPVTDIDYDNSVGFAVQFGADVRLDERWVLNLDIKKLWLNTDVDLNGGAIAADVDIDPWILGLGFGYRFSL